MQGTSDLENFLSVLRLCDHIIGIILMIFQLDIVTGTNKRPYEVRNSVCVVVNSTSAKKILEQKKGKRGSKQHTLHNSHKRGQQIPFEHPLQDGVRSSLVAYRQYSRSTFSTSSRVRNKGKTTKRRCDYSLWNRFIS
jgi:hypothetical protein